MNVCVSLFYCFASNLEQVKCSFQTQKLMFEQVKWSFEQLMVSVMDMFCIRHWTSAIPFSTTETHVWTNRMTIWTSNSYCHGHVLHQTLDKCKVFFNNKTITLNFHIVDSSSTEIYKMSQCSHHFDSITLSTFGFENFNNFSWKY